MPTIAPWLIPADPLQAAKAGTSAGLEYRGQDIQANEHAASLAEAAQEAQMAHQIEQEKVTGTLAQAKAQSDIESKQAAQKFQAQHGYQLALDSGEDPVKALLRFGPQMGASTSGLGQIMLENFKNRQSAMVPQPVINPKTGKVDAYQLGGTLHMTASQGSGKATVPPGLKARLDAAVKMLTSDPDPRHAAANQKRVDELANEMDKTLAGDGEGDGEGQAMAEAPGPAGGSFDYEYDPKAGTFNQVGK
jgi:hypothetical protein